jgi:hypothetical protein
MDLFLWILIAVFVVEAVFIGLYLEESICHPK